VMIRRLERSGAEIRLNTRATPELAQELGPDVIVAALGSRPKQPDVSGTLIPALEALRDPERLGQREVIVGGGLGYFIAYMIAMAIGEIINFPIQKNFVFRSKGNLGKQIAWYVIAFIIINCIVNSINCVWVAVAGLFVPGFIYNIGTVVLQGGVSMVIFFFVNKIIFPEGEAVKNKETAA